jgi:hypothetical protein
MTNMKDFVVKGLLDNYSNSLESFWLSADDRCEFVFERLSVGKGALGNVVVVGDACATHTGTSSDRCHLRAQYIANVQTA